MNYKIKASEENFSKAQGEWKYYHHSVRVERIVTPSVFRKPTDKCCHLIAAFKEAAQADICLDDKDSV